LSIAAGTTKIMVTLFTVGRTCARGLASTVLRMLHGRLLGINTKATGGKATMQVTRSQYAGLSNNQIHSVFDSAATKYNAHTCDHCSCWIDAMGMAVQQSQHDALPLLIGC